MRSLILLLAVFVTAATHAVEVETPATCDIGSAHPSAPMELAQFAFLLGDYQIHMHRWLGQQWSPPQPGVTARWNGRYGLQGMAVVDEWFSPDPAQNPDAGRGVNVRLYDSDEEIWKMMWIDTIGHTVQDLRAKMRNDKLTMWQVYPERPDFKAEFIVHDDDRWERVSYTHDEDGNWVRQFRLAATRIECIAPTAGPS